MSRQVRSTGRAVYRRPSAAPKKRSWPVRHPKMVIAGLVVAGLFYVVILSGWFNITSIVVQGNRSVSQASIVRAANDSLSRHFWYRNIWLVEPGTLSQELESGNYELQQVSVSRQFPHTLVITVVERQPVLFWQTGNDKFVLDTGGLIVATASSTALKLPVVVDTSNLPAKVGDRAVAPGFITFTTDVIAKLAPQTGLSVVELSVADTTNDLQVQTNAHYMLKFDTTRSVDDQINDLVAVLAKLKADKKTPSEYIDLRIPGRVFYK